MLRSDSEGFYLLKTMYNITFKLNKHVNSNKGPHTFIQFVYFYWVLMYVLLFVITFDLHQSIVIQEDLLCMYFNNKSSTQLKLNSLTLQYLILF